MPHTHSSEVSSKPLNEIVESQKGRSGEIRKGHVEALDLNLVEMRQVSSNGHNETFAFYSVRRRKVKNSSEVNYRWLCSLTIEEYNALGRKTRINGDEILALYESRHPNKVVRE